MEDGHLPTLFDILNRFSKAPLDLWSFYVFLKEQYGGVEYLEFWLDCASHTALCKEVARELTLKNAGNGYVTSSSGDNSDRAHRRSRGLNSSDDADVPSPSSSVLFNMLQEPQSSNISAQSHIHGSMDNTNAISDRLSPAASLSRQSISSHRGDNEIFEDTPVNQDTNLASTMSNERAKNKRDTVSRLSEILDNLHMPEYPDPTATSPTRHAKLHHDVNNEYDAADENDSSHIYHRRQKSRTHGGTFTDINDGYIDGISSVGGDNAQPQILSNPSFALTSGSHQPDPDAFKTPHAPLEGINSDSNKRNSDPASLPSNISIHDKSQPSRKQLANPSSYAPLSQTVPATGAAGGRQLGVKASRSVIRESAQQIINTYLSPKGPKEIELPADANGWSLANDIRLISTVPGGLTNPKIFDNATAYVFEALEREALPAFLLHRGLCNVQPLSSSFRLVTGLISLFGGFWLSFVFILLDWEPKAHRCWVILPFGVGMYLTLTALYHIDPLLAYTGYCEKDGGGLTIIHDKAVRIMQVKRASFVLLTIILCTAAFSVLFIFVPGHRL